MTALPNHISDMSGDRFKVYDLLVSHCLCPLCQGKVCQIASVGASRWQRSQRLPQPLSLASRLLSSTVLDYGSLAP
jgi:hypothetical protein